MNSNRTEISRKQLADTVKRRWGTPIERQLELGEGKRDRPNQVADSWITAKVQAEIFNEPSLKVARINVETCKARGAAERPRGCHCRHEQGGRDRPLGKGRDRGNESHAVPQFR